MTNQPPAGALPHGEWLAAAAALALGRLPPDQVPALDAHLAGCAGCRSEQSLLEATVTRMSQVPPEAYLDGPPDGADLLIRRTVRAIRAQDGAGQPGRPRSRPSLPRLVAAAAVIVAVGAGGIVGGRLTAPSGPPVAGPGQTSSPTPDAPGTRLASVTDRATGVRLTVKVVPASGWVRLTVNTAGIRQGERCWLVVLDRAGKRTVAGSWLVSAGGANQGTGLTGSALVDPSQVSAVRVENADGAVLVTATL